MLVRFDIIFLFLYAELLLSRVVNWILLHIVSVTIQTYYIISCSILSYHTVSYHII